MKSMLHDSYWNCHELDSNFDRIHRKVRRNCVTISSFLPSSGSPESSIWGSQSICKAISQFQRRWAMSWSGWRRGEPISRANERWKERANVKENRPIVDTPPDISAPICYFSDSLHCHQKSRTIRGSLPLVCNELVFWILNRLRFSFWYILEGEIQNTISTCITICSSPFFLASIRTDSSFSIAGQMCPASTELVTFWTNVTDTTY